MKFIGIFICGALVGWFSRECIHLSRLILSMKGLPMNHLPKHIEIREDSDQSGLWLWYDTLAKSGSDISFPTPTEAEHDWLNR